MRINKTSCTVAVLLVVTILKIFVDPIEMDPAIEQHEREQESKLVDDFYSYVTQPVHGQSFGFQDHSFWTKDGNKMLQHSIGLSLSGSCDVVAAGRS